MLKFTMRKILWIALMVGTCGSALAQFSGQTILIYPGVPSGSCAQTQLGLNGPIGDLYSCAASNTWVKVGPNSTANNPGGSVNQIQFNSGGVSFGGFTMSQDCTINVSTGVITCTKTNGVAFAPSATTDTTNASNISSGTLPNARLVNVPNGSLQNSSLTVATGVSSGLSGGGAVSLGGTLNISLLSTCSTNQVLQWSGSAWVCASVGTGSVTSITGGTGLSGGTITGSGTLAILTAYQLPQGCSTNQIAQWNGSAWICANAGAGSVTGATANGGLLLTSTTLGLLTSCSSNQVLQWNGSAWVCATISGTIPGATIGFGTAYTSSSSLVTGGIANPLFAVSAYSGADVNAKTNTALQSGSTAPVVDSRNWIGSNTVSHSPWPQFSTNTNGWVNLVPSGTTTTSVPYKAESIGWISRGQGRGGNSSTGGSVVQAAANYPYGVGSGGSITGSCSGTCTWTLVSGGTGYYYYPTLSIAWSPSNSCTTQPNPTVEVTDGVITGIVAPPFGGGSLAGAGCGTNVPTVTINPGAPNNGQYNMSTFTGPVFSPFVIGIGGPPIAYTEDGQLWDMDTDCGSSGTPSSPNSGDYTTGIAVYGDQESSIIAGSKQTGCMVGLDVGGGSNQAQNFGPVLGNETLPLNNAPNPGTTYLGTPFGTSGVLTTPSCSATAGGVVTCSWASPTVPVIAQGTPITVSGIPAGTHGTLFSTPTFVGAGSTAESVYEVTSPTCTSCLSVTYQAQGSGSADSPSGSYTGITITPWPVNVRFNSTAITAGLWHSTSVGGLNGTAIVQPVVTEVDGLGGLFTGNHAEKGITLRDIGGTNFAVGQTYINEQNTTCSGVSHACTNYFLSNANPVLDQVFINVGSGATTGTGSMPADLFIDANLGIDLTSAQQSWVPFIVKDNVGTMFSMADPSTSNGNLLKNTTNFFNNTLGGIGSTAGTYLWSANALTGAFKAASIVDSGIAASTSPICPNGSGGAFTTSGCSSGSGNTTSTSLTSGTVPKANGANSIVNSLFTDNGTTGTYTGTGGITASAGPLTAGNPSGGVGSSVFLTQEGTIPTGLSTAAEDNCYADSTQHGLLCNFNAGTTLPLVQGPASATSGHIATFSGTNGGKIVDGGAVPAGTVTTFSAGALSPLFTTSVATATTTPALSFTLSSAASGTFLGNNTNASASPAYVTLSAINPQTLPYQVTAADFAAYRTIPIASGTGTVTLVASTGQPAAGQYINIINYGSGVVTIARSGQNINGGTASITLSAATATNSTGATIWSNGTDYVAAVDEDNANSVLNNAANTGTAAMTLDMSASTTAPSLKLPQVIGGTSLAGTSTGALSTPITITNANSSNNNTSFALGVSASGTSTGQTVMNLNQATTGGDILDWGTGASYTAGAISGQTISGSILENGSIQEKGTTAGFFAVSQGSTSSAIVPCNAANTICFQAPTAVTAQLRVFAGAPATGFSLFTNSSGTMTETISATSGTLNSGVGLLGTLAVNTVLSSTVANAAGHFTNIQVVTALGGTCTTLPQFNVFDGATNVGSTVTANAATQTKGTGNSTAQTLTFASGDVIGIFISTAGGTCVANDFIVSAQYSIP